MRVTLELGAWAERLEARVRAECGRFGRGLGTATRACSTWCFPSMGRCTKRGALLDAAASGLGEGCETAFPGQFDGSVAAPAMTATLFDGTPGPEGSPGLSGL